MDLRLKVLLAVEIPATVFASAGVSPMNDSLQAGDRAHFSNVISIDVGMFGGGSDFSGGWRTLFALRAGYGRELMNVIALHGYLDYYQYKVPPASGNSVLVPSWAKRHDAAAYAELSLFHFFRAGAGVYYTTSDAVSGVNSRVGTQYPWRDSGFSEFRAFYIVGVAYDAEVTERIVVPVGLYSRNNYGLNDTLPIFLRVGVGVKF